MEPKCNPNGPRRLFGSTLGSPWALLGHCWELWGAPGAPCGALGEVFGSSGESLGALGSDFETLLV